MMPATMKIYVVAGSQAEYQDCLRAMRTHPQAAVFVDHADRLRGIAIEPGQVVYFGTYMQRPDLAEIVRLVADGVRRSGSRAA